MEAEVRAILEAAISPKGGLKLGSLLAEARTSGLPIATVDGYIAAIAMSNGFVVATRDVGPFEAAGAAVINPWQA